MAWNDYVSKVMSPSSNWWDKKLSDKQRFQLQAPQDVGLLDVASAVPTPVGDVASGLLAAQDVSKGNYGSAALNALGLLPFIPSMGGIVKSANKGKLINIPLSEIEHGESALPGGKLTFPTAKELIQSYANKKTPLPPIEVVSNDAESVIPWMISDGSHRYEAAKLRGMKTIPAYVSPYDTEGLDLIKKYFNK